MARYLSQEQIAEYRECFSLYDKKRNGKILVRDLTTVMRSLGSCPTTFEIQRHMKQLGKKPSEEMDFSEFLTVMHEQSLHEDPPKEILAAFKTMDKRGKGTVSASQLRHLLMHTGEKLTQREIDQMFKAGNIKGSGFINYEDFVRMVTLPLPDY